MIGECEFLYRIRIFCHIFIWEMRQIQMEIFFDSCEISQEKYGKIKLQMISKPGRKR